MAQGDTGGSEGGSWSVGAPSLENFKSNVRSIVDTLRDSLSLTNDNRSAVAQEKTISFRYGRKSLFSARQLCELDVRTRFHSKRLVVKKNKTN